MNTRNNNKNQLLYRKSSLPTIPGSELIYTDRELTEIENSFKKIEPYLAYGRIQGNNTGSDNSVLILDQLFDLHNIIQSNSIRISREGQYIITVYQVCDMITANLSLSIRKNGSPLMITTYQPSVATCSINIVTNLIPGDTVDFIYNTSGTFRSYGAERSYFTIQRLF